MGEIEMNGIDVSSGNGKIDWVKVRNSGIAFAVLRAGWGLDLVSQTDEYVLENARECDRLGIPYGLYLYSYALNESQAHSEASHMIRLAQQTNAVLGYWYDMEDADKYKERKGFRPSSHKTELTTFCKIFLQDMKAAGYTEVGVYANYDYFKNILNLDELRKAGKIWLAQWGVSKPSIECSIWQYSSVGKVDGISGNVDMNVLYGNLPEEDSSEKISLIKAWQTEINRLEAEAKGENGVKLAVDGKFGPACKAAASRYNIRKGGKGIFVTIWQTYLVWAGYNPNGIDGSFGVGCLAATIAFQKASGLSADGIVGSDTWYKALH